MMASANGLSSPPKCSYHPSSLKKFQQTSGSVDEKLATFPFKIREYKRLLDPIGYNLVYMYLLSSNWFDTPKYKDYYDYMDELGCHHYFDILPLKAIGLSIS